MIKVDAILKGATIATPNDGGDPRIVFLFTAANGSSVYAVPHSPDVFLGSLGIGNPVTLTLPLIDSEAAVQLEYDSPYAVEESRILAARSILLKLLESFERSGVPIEVIQSVIDLLDFPRLMRLPFTVEDISTDVPSASMPAEPAEIAWPAVKDPAVDG